MDKHSFQNFAIRFSRKNAVFLLIFLSLLVLTMIYIAVFTEYRAAGIIFGAFSTVLLLLVLLFTIQFRIQVSGTLFSVRTRTGKKFSFDCRDISQIACSKTVSVKYGPSFYIEVFTKENGFSVEGKMDGFKELAGYLLMQLNTGAISENAATTSCRAELKRYANGQIYQKQKNRT